MFRALSIVLAAAATVFGAGAANAATHWSVGINLPVPGVVVTNGGYYVSEPAPIYYAPAPVVRYAPVPVYNAPPAYVPPAAFYGDEPEVYEVPYEARPYGVWEREPELRWDRRRQFEHARWERARHEREEWHRDRDDHRDGGRWRRD